MTDSSHEQPAPRRRPARRGSRHSRPDGRPSLSLTRLGWGLAIPVTFLLLVGLATIHASDRTGGWEDETDAVTTTTSIRDVATEPTHWLVRAKDAIGAHTLRQLMYIATGVALMLLAIVISYRRIGQYAYVVYGVNCALLALLLVDRYGIVDFPFIPERRNTFRWIDFGFFSLQPSEFMKLALVIALAFYLRYRSSYRTWRGLVPPFLLTLFPMALILKQPDLGTLLMLLPLLFAMLFVAGARFRHLVLIVAAGLITMPIFYVFGMKDYQRERVLVVFRQNTEDENWHRKQGYQLRQGFIALGAGGVWGQGYGEGAFLRHRLLPEEHNDFIFALIGNQWGLVGCALVIVAYVVLVIVGLEVVTVTNEPFGRLLAVGAIVMIVAQALLNMLMIVGLAPITGMTLPFVSFGGSSMWANFLALGLLINVAQRRPMLIAKPPFEHAEDSER
ncbi:MAG: rod shape-determining protein RodA [Phycisphaerales bacterium]|nr:rod shape-determining protein RodA [Phycisphaerales bacterium]